MLFILSEKGIAQALARHAGGDMGVEVISAPETIILILSSERSVIPRAVQEVSARLRQRRCPNQTLLLASVVLRELLKNAIHHGNRDNPELVVQCTVTTSPDGKMGIEVVDEGDGFDYGAVDMEIPDDPRGLAHRGYKLIRALCEQLQFNETGNRVQVILSGNTTMERLAEVSRGISCAEVVGKTEKR
jgi:anti-sigma regulatory factor (Ser/Thr protein kinase)